MGAKSDEAPTASPPPEKKKNDLPGCVGFVLYFLITLFLIGTMPPVGMVMAGGGVLYWLFGLGESAGWYSERVGWWLRASLPCLALAFLLGGWLYMLREKRLVVPTDEYNEKYMHLPPHVTARPGPVMRLDEPPDWSGPADELRFVDGATSLAPLYRSLIGYAASMNDVAAGRLNSGTTPKAYDYLIDGAAAYIFAFPPSDEQKERAAKEGRELRTVPVAREAFVFFVNEGNPVESLTVQQLKDIYAGRTVRWSAAGGPDRAITAFQRAKGSGSQSRMERFMADDALAEPPTELRIASMGEIVRRVARYHNHRYALGYSFLYYVSHQVDARGLRLLSVDGIAPSNATIRDGSYPLTDEICVVTAGEPTPTVAEFIDWILSPQGQRLVAKAGYVPLGDEGGTNDGAE